MRVTPCRPASRKRRRQLAFLAEEGCDGVQGYLLGKPLPIGKYAGLVGRAEIMELALKTG